MFLIWFHLRFEVQIFYPFSVRVPISWLFDPWLWFVCYDMIHLIWAFAMIPLIWFLDMIRLILSFDMILFAIHSVMMICYYSHLYETLFWWYALIDCAAITLIMDGFCCKTQNFWICKIPKIPFISNLYNTFK